MKRNHAPSLRFALLPGCLAVALGMGGGVLAPGAAHAAIAHHAHDMASIAAALPDYLSAGEKQAFLRQLQRSARTPPPVPATSIAVTNCNDSGAGSLRDAVSSAVDGDTIDMTALTCSKITLTTGAIGIGLNNLTLAGPGALNLEIDANDADRALWHLGSGTLTVQDVMISHGKKYLADGDVGNPGGGCVFSLGTVNMDHTWTKYCDTGSADTNTNVHGGAIYAKNGIGIGTSFVTGNTAHSSGRGAYGGGVYTHGFLTVAYSMISGNAATSTAGWGQGGGVEVGSQVPGGNQAPGEALFMKYSTISENSASGTTGSIGGGLYLTGNATILNSTISSNAAANSGGLFLTAGPNVTLQWALSNSTVSGNSATDPGKAGGLQAFGNDLKISNSTIAFNTAHGVGTTKYGAGLRIASASNAELQSTIIANNTSTISSGPQPDDIGGVSGATLTGANNLIVFPSSLVTPGGTILLIDPKLRALSGNGGSTSTHMLNFGSPAIDAGNNTYGAAADQRGSGYPRVLGPQADIGAVEFDLPDVIFQNGFD